MKTIGEGTQSAQRILRHVAHGSTFAIDTGRVIIGRAYVPPPPRIASRDAERLQSALLEPKTAQPLPLVQRIAGALWSWT